MRLTTLSHSGIITAMDTKAPYELTHEGDRTQIRFAAFDTNVRICAYGDDDACAKALEQAHADCVVYEALFSRTIPSSDVSRVNAAQGAWVEVEYPAVSVVCERSLDAEGYSTTLLVLGLEDGHGLAAEHPEIVQAYFISWDGSVHPLR